VASDVLPYLVPDAVLIKWGEWELFRSGAWAPMPIELEGWDTGTDVRLRRLITVAPELFESACGIPVAATAATLSWTSSTTGMTEAAAPVRLQGNGLAQLDTQLPGDRISGTVTLRATISLVAPPDPPRPGVARRPGSVLASDSRSLVLEAGRTMFPVDEVDFARTRLPVEASWHLETTTDLAAPFYGTFRLLLNARDSE
jgi:hypothetical protein